MTLQEAMSLNTGEFVGKVVHKSGGFFRMKMHTVMEYDSDLDYTTFKTLPIVQKAIDVDENFNRIQKEVEEIVDGVQ